MPDIINKTESRVAALTQVIRDAVMYRPLTGEFLAVQGSARVVIAGPQRRTYAELRQAGIIQFQESGEREVPMRLTESGEDVADQWGLTSQ